MPAIGLELVRILGEQSLIRYPVDDLAFIRYTIYYI